MKKLLLILLLLNGIVSYPQSTKLALVSNPRYNGTSSSIQFNSLIAKLNSDSLLSSVYFLGNITETGTAGEFESLKLTLKTLHKPYSVLPYKSDVRDFNGYSKYLELFGDDKFVINGGSHVLIGICPVTPYSGIHHYTIENLHWLEETLDSFSLAKEIYFLAPVDIEKTGNMDAVINLLAKKNLKMIISTNAAKNESGSLFGINSLSLKSSYEKINTDLSVYNLLITKDSIIVSSNEKILFAIDKTIQPGITIPSKNDFENFSAEVKTNIDLKSSVTSGAVYWEDKIYTAEESGIVSCYDTSGTLHWDYDTFGTLISSPAVADRMIALPTVQGEIITLSAISGEQIQSIGFEENITTGLTVFEYTGNKLLMIPKLTKSKNALVFGTASGKIYCYDLETLQEYWVNANAQGMIKSPPVVIENKILFSSYDGFLYCIDARNGLLIWRWKEKAGTDFSDSQILTDGKHVYAVSYDNTVYSIDLLLGKLTWKNDDIKIFPSISFGSEQKYLLAESLENKIIQLNCSTGQKSKEFRTDKILSNTSPEIIEFAERIIFTDEGLVSKIDNTNKETKILLIDNSPIIDLKKINSDNLLATTLNGRVLLFSVR
ncbi:MAG: PQQ-binding-like beta-propeller repeat protein [Bacteroidota bacterium]